jgi:peptide/nickel transport system substrate-binding protein
MKLKASVNSLRSKIGLLLAVLLVVSALLSACGDTPTNTAATSATTAARATTASTATTAAAVNTAPPVAATTAANATTAAATGKRGGVVRVGIPQEPDTLNRLLAAQTVSDIVTGLVNEPLIEVSPEGQYVPRLAESVPTQANNGVSADGLTVTYKLKKGVKWSDGKPFTSKDVEFTYKVIMDNANGIPTSGYRLLSAVETPDENTVVLKFKDLYASYLNLFSTIIPQHIFDGKTDITKADFNRKPVGTGPFTVKSWNAQESVILERNANYREAGKPYLDGIIFRVIKSRESAIQAFLANELEVLWDLTEEQIPQFEKLSDARLDIASSVSTERVFLNLSDPKSGDPTSKHPILGDLKVRQAIQLGINKKLMVDSLLYGKTTVATTMIPQGWAKQDGTASEYSVEKAKALLEEAGWKPGADGIREKGGVKMELKFGTTTGNKLREKTQQLMQEQLKAIGIAVKIENVPSDQLFGSWDNKSARKRGTFDMLMWTTEPGIDPANHIYNYLHSKSIPQESNKGAGANYTRWVNATSDKAIEDAEKTLDAAKRKALYQTVADEFNKDTHTILLYNRLNIDAFKKSVQGHKPNIWATAWLMWNAEDWTLNK